jgi:hypothetical protein
VINGREWVADDDFSDSHHLLPHGAKVFTERLGREVLALVRRTPEGKSVVQPAPGRASHH